MNNEENHLLAIQQFAMIWNYNAHVEHQHNYYGERPENSQEVDEVFEPCQLIFFDQVQFGSANKQKKLLDLLSEVSLTFDISSGRGWFCIYAGYRYFKGQLAVLDGYTDFFTDIENLLPSKLPKLDCSIIEKRERYHNYAQLLGREAALWYMDKGKLPPLNEITTWKEHFKGDKTRYEKYCPIIIEIYNSLKKI